MDAEPHVAQYRPGGEWAADRPRMTSGTEGIDHGTKLRSSAGAVREVEE